MSAPGPARRVKLDTSVLPLGDSLYSEWPATAPAVPRDDWETPDDLFRLLDKEFHFTLDGAASFENAKCHEFYSEQVDAFAMRPQGEVIWLNPPYGRGLPAWIGLAKQWAEDNEVVLLLPNATDTAWFADAVWGRKTDEVRLLFGRVQFVGTTSSNPSGSVVVVMRVFPRFVRKWFMWDWKTEIQKEAAA